MTIAASIQQASLVDAPQGSAIEAAVTWISNLLFGPMGTTIAIISVAGLGFVMLSGRIEVKRGISVLFGCFLLFGAREIADGLRSLPNEGDQNMLAIAAPPNFSSTANSEEPISVYDPYAGASVIQPGN